jgi:hypothetical protein
MLSWYGVRRRDSKGSLIAIAGLGLTAGSLSGPREAPEGTVILQKVA